MIVTLGAVAVGAMLALVTTRGRVAMGALRTFAAIAVVAAVLMQLLPEAVHELGIAALGAFVGALVLPRFVVLLASAIRGPRMSARGVGADLGFYGFLLHQWGEGLALGTFGGGEHAGHAHGDLVLGMAAHTVPLTAVFVAATLAARGRRTALVRTGALLIATALGFAAAGTISATQLAGVLPWLSAAVAGFLCHILLHDEGVSVRRTPLTGALDVLAGLAGVALPWLTMGSHPHDAHAASESLHEPLAHAFYELVAATTPLLLLGLVLGAGLQVLGSRTPGRYLGSGGAVRQAWRGIGIGASLPLCACGALPLADTLRRRGAGPALVVAFLMSVPELGPETLLLTFGFLGAPFAGMRLGAALLVAFVAALAFGRLAGAEARTRAQTEAHESSGSMITGARPRQREGWGLALDYFDELLLHIGPWVLVGLVAAAYLQVAVAPGSLAGLADRGLDVVVVGLIAVPTFVCAAAATPLAAVLLLEGISPGAVLVGLLMGPATNVASIAMLRRGYGLRVVVLGIGAMLGLSIGLGLLVNALELPLNMPATPTEPHALGWGWISTAATSVLVVMLLRQLWRWGTHPWFEILDAGSHGHGHGHGEHDPDHHPHGHSHAHDHDHDHHHDHDHDHGPPHEHHAPGDEHRHHHAHDHDHIPGLPDLDQLAPPGALHEGERTDVDP